MPTKRSYIIQQQIAFILHCCYRDHYEPRLLRWKSDQYATLTYGYNDKGYIATRGDQNTSQYESYTYDALGRLTQVSVDSVQNYYFGYDASQPHAVSSVRATEGSISPSRCEAGYNSRNRPATIVEEDWKLDIAHGSGFRFHRGFTGHEHYDEFGVINMNARLYDPVLGRFFSPAPQV